MKDIINSKLFVFIKYFILFQIVIFQLVDAKEIKKNTYNQKINVIFDNNNKKINIGTPVTVNWDINDRIIKANEDNLEFVVFSMPYTVRLKGDYFLPIPPKQNLPFDIKYDTYMFRVVFPLYLIKQTRGSFIFTPWKAGDFNISWAYFSIKKNTTEITKDSNIVEQLSQNQLYKIIDTRPKIIVQEQVPSMKPKKTIVSLSEKYTIKIYDTWFEVLDTKSENLIFKKTGRNPNFSDSSRFLCYIYGSKIARTINIIDMISQTLILSSSGDVSSPECLGWGKNEWILFFYYFSKYSYYCEFKFPTLDTQRAGSLITIDDCTICVEPLVSCSNPEYKTEYFENETQNCRFYYPFPLCKSLNNKSLLLPEDKENRIKFDKRSIISYMKKHDIIDDFCSMYWEDYEEKVDWYKRRGHDWQIEGGFYFSHLLPTPPPERIRTEYEFEVQDFLNDHTVDKFYNKQLKKINDTSFSVAKKNNFINNQIIRSKSIPIYYPLSPYKNKAILERLRDMNYIFYKNETSKNKDCSGCCNLTEMITKGDNCIKYDNYEENNNDSDNCSLLSWENSGNIYTLEKQSRYYTWGGSGDRPGQISLSMIMKTYDSVKEFYFFPADSFLYESTYIHYTDNYDNMYNTFFDGYLCDELSPVGIIPWTFMTSMNFTNEIKAYFSTSQILMCSISDLDVMFIFDPSEQNFSEKVEFIKENDSYYRYLKNKKLSKTEKFKVYCEPCMYEHLESSLQKKKFTKRLKIIDIFDSEYIESLHLSEDYKKVLQLNKDGKIFIYNIESGDNILSGHYINDELVLFDHKGYYDSTAEGDKLVKWYYSGLNKHYNMDQFKKIFNRPDIIRNIYNDKPVELKNPLIKQNLLPPEVVFESIIADEKSNQVKLNLYASSSSTLNKLHLFVDGAINSVSPVTEDQERFSFNLEISNGIRWITTLVEDKYGLESIPKSVMINFSQNKLPSGNLYVLGVGINKYLHLNELKYAQKDVNKFIDIVLSVKSKQYSKTFTTKLYNDNATATAITNVLRQIQNQSSSSDTLFLYLAGHGGVNKTGNYYFFSSDTKSNSVERTALSLNSVIRILDQINARKIVFIDTCHSGLISIDYNSINSFNNEKNLIQGNNLVIMSASKSRQYSRGSWLFGHGIFSYYIIQALGKQRYQVDTNENNVIELSELYRFVKQKVVHFSKGEQTPWLFNKMVGEVPLL